jgi:arginyl-tRNA synthetase
MADLKTRLQAALKRALGRLDVHDVEVVIQEAPEDKAGDYGTPVAFGLAKTLRKNPALIAQEIASRLELPQGVTSAEAVGPYINFSVDPAAFVREVVQQEVTAPPRHKKIIVEHTSVNPNKEAHVGHLRNIVLGDSVARILKVAGASVEVQNYIDDTGRQAAESLFAMKYFDAEYDGKQKYDHWLGELYVRLTKAKEADGEAIEAGVREVMRRLEKGELRTQVEDIVRAQLRTYTRLGAEYDLLVWESDVVAAGLLARGLAILEASDYASRPQEGKFANALVMDVSAFLPGLEEPKVVLVRSDGNAMYVAKDIGYHYWKAGMFGGLTFARFATQPSGKPLYSSAPAGEPHPEGRTFAHGGTLVNVIDARQSHPQQIVKAALQMAGEVRPHELRHLAYEVVTLEGQAMSGRKGVTLSIDEVMDEAVKRARAVITEKNPELDAADWVAEQVGIGALRFGMLRGEARRVLDFRWEQALSLQGDSAPYVQYAHARACSILRAAEGAGLSEDEALWDTLGGLEVRLAQGVARFPEVIRAAARDLAPHLAAQYALELATQWNGYYNHKDARGKADTQVLKAERGLREARLALVRKVKETLAEALGLLGIAAPKKM